MRGWEGEEGECEGWEGEECGCEGWRMMNDTASA